MSRDRPLERLFHHIFFWGGGVGEEGRGQRRVEQVPTVPVRVVSFALFFYSIR
jgi:hypothetical protein